MYDGDPDKLRYYEKASELFFQYYHEYFDYGTVKQYQVPFQKGYLPVMVTKAVGEQKGTILLHGGNDSYYEELFYPMLYLAEQGYDVYLFEGPGQGGVLRRQNMKFQYDWEKSVAAILDYFALDDVTIIGASLGAYLAPRAAAFERIIRQGSSNFWIGCFLPHFQG
ncbi:MAG: alpha/beta fold hydrolase [Lachnospiraceae bacterium]|nr:alpha/beta fold hydrolase [Lachnospiraceae bacterium]